MDLHYGGKSHSHDASKRQRSPNFTAAERALLLELTKQYRAIVDNKDNSWYMMDKKVKVWEVITSQFNCYPFVAVKRTIKQVQKGYENMRRFNKMPGDWTDEAAAAAAAAASAYADPMHTLRQLGIDPSSGQSHRFPGESSRRHQAMLGINPDEQFEFNSVINEIDRSSGFSPRMESESRASNKTYDSYSSVSTNDNDASQSHDTILPPLDQTDQSGHSSHQMQQGQQQQQQQPQQVQQQAQQQVQQDVQQQQQHTQHQQQAYQDYRNRIADREMSLNEMIAMDSKERIRGKNYQEGEREVIVYLVEQQSEILCNKENTGEMWRKKDIVWDKITEVFNLIAKEKNYSYRTKKQIKSAYDNYKRQQRTGKISEADMEKSSEILRNLQSDRVINLIKSVQAIDRKDLTYMAMDTEKKRIRGKNWSEAEKQTLLCLTREYSSVIQNTATTAEVWRQKDTTWDRIVKIYNSLAEESGWEERNKKQLRSAYDSYKKITREGQAREGDGGDDPHTVEFKPAAARKVPRDRKWRKLKPHEKTRLLKLVEMHKGPMDKAKNSLENTDKLVKRVWKKIASKFNVGNELHKKNFRSLRSAWESRMAAAEGLEVDSDILEREMLEFRSFVPGMICESVLHVDDDDPLENKIDFTVQCNYGVIEKFTRMRISHGYSDNEAFLEHLLGLEEIHCTEPRVELKESAVREPVKGDTLGDKYGGGQMDIDEGSVNGDDSIMRGSFDASDELLRHTVVELEKAVNDCSEAFPKAEPAPEQKKPTKQQSSKQADGSDTLNECVDLSQVEMLVKKKISELSQSEQRVQCSVCQKYFNSEVGLRTHYARFHEKHICEICGRHLGSLLYLKNHLALHGLSDRQYSCEFCGKTVSSKAVLEEHRRVHTNERPFVCDFCSKAYKSKTMLLQHVRKAHTRENLVYCQFCNRGFSTNSERKLHEKKHSGEFSHTCRLCGFKFVEESKYIRHMYIKHKEGKLFECFCGSKFVYKNGYDKHVATYHASVENGTPATGGRGPKLKRNPQANQTF